MQLTEAIELGIVTVDEDRNLHYNGLCNECKHSKCTAYPAQSHMCMNEKSEWYGCFHVDYSLQRYVDGCHVFEKINKDLEELGMEIKYRAWDKGRKEYLSAGNVFIGINPKSRPKESNIYLDLIDHPDMYKDRFIIEPFTGLKDINGNEIYKGDRLRSHGNNDDIVVVEYGEFYVINVETLEKIDKVIGWHTDVLKTDGISMCEPFCLSMPLTEEYIQRCGYEVLRKTIHEVEMEKVIK